MLGRSGVLVVPQLLVSLLSIVMADWSSPNGEVKRTIYIGVMAPESKWWGRGIPVAMEMAIEAVNNRSDVLRGYKVELLRRNTMGDTGLGNKVFFDFMTEKKTILMLGPSRSNVAESVGASAKYFNVVQISPSAASGKLSEKKYYPYFFRTLPALSSASKTFVRMARHFKWKQVAILYYSRELFVSAAEALREECITNNITILSYGSYFEDPSTQIQHLKQIDARIIFAFLGKTTGVMCEIYKQGMNANKYAWVVNTADSHPWWNRTFTSVSCTPDEVYQGAKGIISVDYSFISQQKESTVSGLTPQDFVKEFHHRITRQGYKDTPYKGFAYDAAWLAALGLTSSLRDLGPKKTLDQIQLGNREFTRLLRKHILRTNFMGVTGFVELDARGDRSGIFDVCQLQGNSLVPIYGHETSTDNFSQYEGMELKWKGGRPPADRLLQLFRTVRLSVPMFIFLCCVAAAGLILSLGFLQFNFLKRQKRVIKMSSPNLNNVIIMGCMTAYSSVILYAVDGELLTSAICRARGVCLSVGFTLAYGAMFSKTWRVHRITRILTTKKKFIKDIHLLSFIGVLLLVDIIIWTVWSIVDPLTKSVTSLASQVDPENSNLMFVPQLHYCRTTHNRLWMGLLCGYKGVLLLFGLFLAWETRNVKIPALNDSHHIGMAVYNVVIVCVVGVPTVLFFQAKQHNVYFIVTAICITSCTTTTLLLVFIPKIAALRQSSTKGCRPPGLSSCNSINATGRHLSAESSHNFNHAEELEKLRELLRTLQLEKEGNVVPTSQLTKL